MKMGLRLHSGARSIIIGAWTLLFVAPMLAFTACASNDLQPSSTIQDSPQPSVTVLLNAEPLEAAELEEQWGMRLLRATTSAGGGMIDLRYQIVDSVKAQAMLDLIKEEVAIIDEATGSTAQIARIAKFGELTKSGSAAGSVNYILFGNPDGLIQPGSSIVVVAKDIPLGRILVQ